MTTATPSGVVALAPPAPSHHGIFAALVQDDTDLVGHVAYALYKRDKLKFCDEEFGRSGNGPTEVDINVFIRACKLDTRIAAYRAEAERLLEQMTEYVLEDAFEKIQEDSQKELIAKLSAGKSWGRAIGEEFVGSVVVALVWAAIVLLVATNQVGFTKVVGDAMGKDIVDKPKITQPATPPP